MIGKNQAHVPVASFDRKRDHTQNKDSFLRLNSIDAVQSLTDDQCVAAQRLLQQGDHLGLWHTPRKWAPAVRGSLISVDLRKRILHFMPENEKAYFASMDGMLVLRQALLVATRYLILLRVGPAANCRRKMNRSLDPSNVGRLAYEILPALFAVVLQSWRKNENQCIENLFDGPQKKLDLAFLSRRCREGVLLELARMRMLGDRGLWPLFSKLPEQLISVTEVAGPTPIPHERPKRQPHLPFPDDYISQMGTRSIWLIENLAPNLIKILEQIKKIWSETLRDDVKPQTIAQDRSSSLRNYLSEFEWMDSSGHVLGPPPFQLRLSQKGSLAKSICETKALNWPPRSFSEIMGLVQNVQLAHVFAVALPQAPRLSEVVSLRRDCLIYSKDGVPYATGRTFKLVESHEGNMRDWVLPDFATIALEQQVRMLRIAELVGPIVPNFEDPPSQGDAPTHLWARLGCGGINTDRTAPLINISQALTSFALSIGMHLMPGGQSIRIHRIRKTVARLVALALTQAPKILMDVFGHKSIEMTLYYILTDKNLRSEVEDVSRELRVLRSKMAVESIIDSENSTSIEPQSYGGRAAASVSQAIQAFRLQTHRVGAEWGADSSYKLAKVLTLQGESWDYVRRGVICTKFPGESGPCSRSKGRPEPGACSTKCNHRLEEGFLRAEVDESIRDAVNFYQEAISNDDELMASMWAGQIRSNVSRFSDLADKWRQHDLVRKLIEVDEAINE